MPLSAILRGGIVHQKAMLDALHTRCNGLLDRFGREGMYSNCVPQFWAASGPKLGSVKVTTSIGLNGDENASCGELYLEAPCINCRQRGRVLRPDCRQWPCHQFARPG